MLYIFHGPDDFSRKEKIEELRAAFADPALADLNMTFLEGREVSLSEIRHHADAMPFMGERRLVVVNDYISRLEPRSEEAQRLSDYLGHLAPSTDLVLVERESVDKRHPVLKAATAAGASIVHFGGPDKRNLRGWISERVERYQGRIEPRAAEMLGRLVGADLRTLDTELEKLVLYTGSERPITPEDVSLLVPYVEEAENFGLANALGQRDARRAYDQLHKLVDEGKHPMAILGSIAAQVRGLLEVKDMAERGLTPAEIAREKQWRSDYAAKMRLREASNFSAARLEEILELLLEIDLEIKTGRIDNLLALDTLVARLCTVKQA